MLVFLLFWPIISLFVKLKKKKHIKECWLLHILLDENAEQDVENMYNHEPQLKCNQVSEYLEFVHT